LIGGMVIAGYTLAVVLTHGAALVALPFVGKLLGGLLGGGAVAQAGVGAAAAAGVYGASTLPGLSVYSFLKKLFPGKNQHKSHDSSYKSHPKERFSESYGVIQDHLPNAPEGKKRPDPVDNKNQYHYGSPVNTARRKNPESTVQDTGLSTNQRAFQ